MQEPDLKRFRAVMIGMGKVYEREIDAPLLDAYWLSLKSWSLTDFEQAAGHLMRTSKFMPRPADFGELRKAGRKTPGEAWALAQASYATGQRNVVTGEYSGSRSGDELVDQAVRMIGGYSVIGRSTDEQLGFLERRFCEHYEALEGRTDVREAVPQIAAMNGKRLGGPDAVRRFLPPGEDIP